MVFLENFMWIHYSLSCIEILLALREIWTEMHKNTILKTFEWKKYLEEHDVFINILPFEHINPNLQ